jgi:hypothetical protein
MWRTWRSGPIIIVSSTVPMPPGGHEERIREKDERVEPREEGSVLEGQAHED